MNRFYLGVLLVFLSAAGFGVMPLFTLFAYQNGASVTNILFLRFMLSAVFFFLYIFFKKEKVRMTKSQILSLFVLGGVFYTLQSTFYYHSITYIPASLAAFLFYTSPIFVAVLNLLISKERMAKPVIAATGLSIFGLFLLFGASFGVINVYGVVLAFLSAVVYSFYIVVGHSVVKQLSPVVTSAFIALFASVSLFLIGMFLGEIDFRIDIKVWGFVLTIVIFSTIVAMFSLFRGLDLIGSTKASVLSMVEPLVTSLCSALFLSETLTWMQVLGGLIVLSGSMLIVLTPAKREITETAKNGHTF
ncbi:DMT family transporter [Effusibacillus lacus]|uniref:Permease n=1 Tax=Effusibacillus lacus TaxID=1348429 RepID=A0A292YKT1_9BACL|nr:DMT family transporter [Effusibacillus lacus]TCS75519.1 threonine/homoserine efflux transporter RhtA [Effusibacillus lacus]GAX88984.1 permease [Effusibacillus lacus]